MENLKKHLFSNQSSSNESRSVFHVTVNGNDATSQEVQDCCESIEEFHSAVRNLVGAGTHLTETLTKALKDSSFQCIGDEFSATFREVYSCSQMTRWAEQMKEMGTLLLNLKDKLDENRTEDLSKLPAQIYCHVLMLFLRMQKGYHHFCDEKLDALVTRLCDTRGNNIQKEMTKQLLNILVSNESLRSDSRSNGNSPSKSSQESPKTKQDDRGVSHKTPKTFRSSLLSLFERKQSPDDQKSAFYVDIKHDVAGCIKEEDSKQAAGSPTSNSNLQTAETTTAASPVVNNSSPCSTTDSGNNDLACMTAANQTYLSSVGFQNSRIQGINVVGCSLQFGGSSSFSKAAGLATEEELESVINLLSGVNTNSSPMQVIPENLTIPPTYRMPSPASDIHIDETNMSRAQHHRCSEGSIDLSGMGRNTWPNMHRASLPTVQPLTARQYPEQRETTMLMRCSFPDTNCPSSVYLLPSGLTTQSSTVQLGCEGNGDWPNKQGSETVTSGWSGVQDSSDLSDDSSSGEQFYAVGRDLVQAIETKDDSSDDEFDKEKRKQNSSHLAGFEVQNNCYINTWPLKPWSQSNQFLNSDMPLLETTEELPSTHRPVQMQWSDPMSTRSMWPSIAPGFSQQRTSQSMQGFGNLQ